MGDRSYARLLAETVLMGAVSIRGGPNVDLQEAAVHDILEQLRRNGERVGKRRVRITRSWLRPCVA